MVTVMKMPGSGLSAFREGVDDLVGVLCTLLIEVLSGCWLWLVSTSGEQDPSIA
jgi:hypothetical protein